MYLGEFQTKGETGYMKPLKEHRGPPAHRNLNGTRLLSLPCELGVHFLLTFFILTKTKIE